MNLLATYGVLGLLLCATASADVITNGLSMSDVQKAMEAAHYRQTRLDITADKLSEDLQFWDVDQGVLILRFTRGTSLVLGMTYFLCDERPKALRKTFQFEVLSFDSGTGAMTIKPSTNQLITPSERSEITAIVRQLTGQNKDANILSIRRKSIDTVKVRTLKTEGSGLYFILQRTNGVWEVIKRGSWVE